MFDKFDPSTDSGSLTQEPDQPKENDNDVSKNKAAVIRQILRNIQTNLEQVLSLLGDSGVDEGSLITTQAPGLGAQVEEPGRIIEGVFDGQNMIGPDGKQYTVPANYASKSKLVEGDILKLAISRSGAFMYKQIGPVERGRLIGTLAQNPETNDHYVLAGNKRYQILTASVTYFKGAAGDEVVILVPKDGESRWAAVENIIKKGLGAAGDIETEAEEAGDENEEAVFGV